MSPNARNPRLLVKASAGIASALRRQAIRDADRVRGRPIASLSLARGRHPGGQLSASPRGADGAIVGRVCLPGMRASDRKGGSSRGANGPEPPVMTLMHATLLRKKTRAFPTAPLLRADRYTRVTSCYRCGQPGLVPTKPAAGLRSRPRGRLYTARKHNSAGPFSDSKGWNPPFPCSQDLACRPRQVYRICFRSLC